MQFKDLKIGDRFTIPVYKQHPSNQEGQYAIKLSEMVHEVRSGNENPRLIKESHGHGTISTPTWIDPDIEVEKLPDMKGSFGENNSIPVIGQLVWFKDEHIGSSASPVMYENVREGIVYRVFQNFCDIRESDGSTTSQNIYGVYDHKPRIETQMVEEFFGSYEKTVLI
jgi:hypothetical protein